MKQIFRLMLLALVLYTYSCTEKYVALYGRLYEEGTTVDNALLIYMAGDNSLSGYTSSNLNDIYSYFEDTPEYNARVIVYRDYLYDVPKLLEVKINASSGEVETVVLEEYEEHNSASGEVLSQVISDFLTHSPAYSYKLDLWSHGDGWVTKASTDVSSRAVLQDGSDWLNISELRDSLVTGVFDCILFDACLMGNIEVAYALREKANYIVASPSEVPANGMPYAYMTGDLLRGDYQSVAEKYFEYYNTSTYSSCGLIGVYDLSKIDALKDSFNEVVRDEYSTINSVKGVGIQQFSSISYEYYDLLDFVSTLCSDTEKVAAFESALNDFVVYKRYKNDEDEYGWGLESARWGSFYQVTDFCGTSCYIPFTTSTLLSSYKTTDWYLATYATFL